jgi:hypothetical protein
MLFLTAHTETKLLDELPQNIKEQLNQACQIQYPVLPEVGGKEFLDNLPYYDNLRDFLQESFLSRHASHSNKTLNLISFFVIIYIFFWYMTRDSDIIEKKSDTRSKFEV